MEVNVQKQCVKVFTAEGVINMQPLVVLTQDLSGVAQQDTLVQGIGDIRDDISHISIDTSTLAKQGENANANLSTTQQAAAYTANYVQLLAKQGTNTNATLTTAQTAAQSAAQYGQNINGLIGTPQSGQPDTLFGAIANINIDTSTIAQRTDVKDGNDTAISVAKEIRSEVGTGSDTAAESGTLFAVLKWVKDKVKSIFNLIGSPASGQPSTLFAAIAAGGGGGGETITYPTIQMTAASTAIDPNKVYIWGEMSAITITALNAGEAGVANVYFLEFYSGTTATTLTLPASVTDIRGDIIPNAIINVAIFNNIAYIA